MIGTRPVPVTMGSPVFRFMALDGFDIVEAWFPPGEYLARHTHDRACVAMMLEGSFDLSIGGRVHSCPPTAVATEPLGESHANRIGTAGARVVVIQPDPTRTDLLGPFGQILDRPSHRHHAGVAACAARLARELDRPDDLASLAAEAAVLEILVVLSRLGLDLDAERAPPPWLLRARELVHARFRGPLQIAEVAREVDVHPGHLARAFRRHFRVTLGSYVRRLRLDWVAARLGVSEESLASIALAAGFADQSHLTRAFKGHTGLTPRAYRRARAGRAS
ncbi:MAG: helix-turn-helix domain-containing protein [Gemmatimonadales bacterium]